MNQLHSPIHPGKILQEIWPEGLTLTAAAEKFSLPRSTLFNILMGDASITINMAIKLHNWSGISTERWLHMQIAHDEWVAKRHPHPNEVTFPLAA
jgi:addiction module HigA family antidote